VNHFDPLEMELISQYDKRHCLGDDMFRLPKQKGYRRAIRIFVLGVMAIACGLVPRPSRADQGGIGFWLPGTFGSLAATPMQPGLSMSAL